MNKKKRPIEAYLSFFLLLSMTIVMFIGFVFRYVFNASLSWSEELSRYLFIWFIFISMSYAVTERAHIRVEALNRLIPLEIRKYVNIFGKCIWLAFSLFVSYLGVTYAMTMSSSVSAALKLPMSVVYFGIPLGYALMSVRLFVQIIQAFKDPYLEVANDLAEEGYIEEEGK